MTITQLLTILRARITTIISTFLIVVMLAILACVVIPKKYKATTTVIVNYKWSDPISGFSLPAQLLPGYMSTQVDIITSPDLVAKVIKSLKLDESDYFKSLYADQDSDEGNIDEWLTDWLLKRLDVSPSRTSSTIEISFKGASPKFAADVANSFARNYIEKTIQLKIEPSKQAATFYSEQIESLKKDLEIAQENLTKYQKEHEIFNINSSLDLENSRLNELSTKLTSAHSQAVEALSRQKNLGGIPSDSPDIAADSIVQTLKTQLAQAESKLTDVSAHYDKNHPDYIAAKSNVEQIKLELDKQISATSRAISGSARIFSQNEADLTSSLELQKRKVLELNIKHNELNSLIREVDTAQQAYTAATQRFNQSNFEGQSNQSNITLLNTATPPNKPSSPKVLLILAAAIMIGGFAGILLATIRELFDRRIRSTEDLFSVTDAPLLGVLTKTKLNRSSSILPKVLPSKKPKIIANNLR